MFPDCYGFPGEKRFHRAADCTVLPNVLSQPPNVMG